MGCLQTKFSPPKEQTENTKTYSWDQRKKVNPKDYTFDQIKNQTVFKLPGSVDGMQFIIQNCENSSIYIFDHMNTITVDDCTNCTIVLGPIKGSVFIRNCKNCRMALLCQQFRSRDCSQVDIFLCCTTQPIIESSNEMRFGCYSFAYLELENQCKAAGLSVYNNCWFNIHDFTPVDDEKNWKIFPRDARLEDFFVVPTEEELSSVKFSFDNAMSPVPQTVGNDQKISDKSCLVVFFADGHVNERALAFTKEISNSENVLLRTKEVALDSTEAEKIFVTTSYNEIVKRGPVIALEVNGDDAINFSQNLARALASEMGSMGLVYVSSTTKVADRQIQNIFSYADIQMTV